MGGDTTMSDITPPLGVVLHSFFVDHLITVKGLRPASVRSYRDTIRLLLTFVAADKGCRITRLTLGDLSFERMVSFLRYLEVDRHNHVRTRNQRLAAIHALFDYIATRSPEMLGVCQRVAAIPMKRSAPAETRFLERDEVEQLLRQLPADGRLALRDRAILLFLYNTGARVQEVADLLDDNPARSPGAPVFAAHGHALTRFGIYKVVRRHASNLDNPRVGRKVSPHIFRHTAAVHLLEAGVEINVIRGWLGHADLTTTNRYAEINTRAKLAALRATEPPGSSAGPRVTPVWRSDKAVLDWLASL
jgi:integrase/recombinase XerD